MIVDIFYVPPSIKSKYEIVKYEDDLIRFDIK